MSVKRRVPLRQVVKVSRSSARVAEAHDRLIAEARFDSVILIRSESHFRTDRMPPDFEEGQLATLVPKYRFSFVEEAHALFCGSLLTAFLMPVGEEPDPDRAIVQVTGEYLLRYVLPGDLSGPDEAFEMFARRTAVFNAWPFFRELVHSFAGRMGTPPLVLPLLTMPPNAYSQSTKSVAAAKVKKPRK